MASVSISCPSCSATDGVVPFLYLHLLMALVTLVVFQMIGGITDFYRSWRGVRITTELLLLLQNWTLSLVFSAGLLAFDDDFSTHISVWLGWYLLTTCGNVALVHPSSGVNPAAKSGSAHQTITDKPLTAFLARFAITFVQMRK